MAAVLVLGNDGGGEDGCRDDSHISVYAEMIPAPGRPPGTMRF